MMVFLCGVEAERCGVEVEEEHGEMIVCRTWMKVSSLLESQLKTPAKRDFLPSTIFRRCVCLVFVYTLAVLCTR